MEIEVKRIIQFIKDYAKNITHELSDKEMTEFVQLLQNEIEQMDFSVPRGTTIVAYSGNTNGVEAWRVVAKASEVAKGEVTYISDLPAGTLISKYRQNLEDALKTVVDDKYIAPIMSGYTDSRYKTRIEGGRCGFGDNLLSLDDFISRKLMGETKGANSNLIVFVPEGVDPTKVFATTELDRIFANKTFSTINGIPKGKLQAIYNCEPAGRQAVYDILTATAKEAVGNVIEGQAGALVKEISKIDFSLPEGTTVIKF